MELKVDCFVEGKDMINLMHILKNYKLEGTCTNIKKVCLEADLILFCSTIVLSFKEGIY